MRRKKDLTKFDYKPNLKTLKNQTSIYTFGYHVMHYHVNTHIFIVHTPIKQMTQKHPKQCITFFLCCCGCFAIVLCKFMFVSQ